MHPLRDKENDKIAEKGKISRLLSMQAKEEITMQAKEEIGMG